MESPAASAHRGLVPWLGLLLAASLLTFWSLPTTAQLTIESVPPNAAEGKDVLLLVHNLPGDLRGYVWYKGETVDSNQKIVSYNIDTQATTHGPAYSDQMEMYTNGSLLFQNVTLKDTGMYMLLTVDKNDQNKPVTGQLHVYPVLPKPSITSNNSNPKEHKDPVMLTCEPQTENTTYLWLINSQSLQDSARLQLSMDNRTLTLLIVTRNDMGPYECENQNPGSAGRSDPFTLNVLYGPDTPTISPSDSHYLRGTNLSLSCQAASNPPAQYSWLINESSQQPTQELFISNITLKNSGSYTCLAHNSVTGLTRASVKTVTVYEPVGKPTLRASNAAVTENKDTVVLTCLTNDMDISIRWLFKNQNLLLSDRMKLSRDNSTLTIDPVRREDAGGYQCEVFNPVSSGKSDPFRLDVQSSLLTFWSLPSTAQLTIESVPPNAAEGKEVLLRVHNLPEDLERYAWYKGEVVENSKIVSYKIVTQSTNYGPAYSGRETIYPNGSLLLQNVTLKDTGKYILQVMLRDYDTKQVTGQLRVYPSLLTFWSLPTTAQFTMESVPPNAAEGKDVLLRVHNLPGDLRRYAWYKGEIVENNEIVSYVIETQTTINGTAYSGRETIYPNGSLLLQNVTLKDTGKYNLQLILRDYATKQVTGQLRVYPVLPKPSITSNNSNPEEHKDPVVLTCEPQTENTTYLWLINSQSLQDSARLQLSKDNRTLTLLIVMRNDTGPYECEIQNPVSAGRSDPLTLNVLCGPDTPSISPSNSHYLRGTNLSLSCQAACNPPARYSWIINGGPQQHTQELFIPNITAHDSGSYICLAHNSITGLTRTTVKTITVYEQTYTGYSVGTIVGSVIGILVVVALGASLGYFLYLRRTRRPGSIWNLCLPGPPTRPQDSRPHLPGISQPKHRGVLPDHSQSRCGFLVPPGPDTPDPADVACIREPALSIMLSEISQWEKR
ncbi:carcinoembryonic antigen-related cell adhesion molecule 5 isoform X5 [Pipistrellus kuhlii]|uniref:carcinoembryonic antigen-related cell adhesion molecule 5 isoform X5 n=1 Tax=Pipistrellus kuhlii TaxID=59472 RepID=UPI001E273D0F|nr:carcinoembryonic antigen-related cell adhesion molecule 5 isoform X5 [Pipistrellus kuhlii]